jgi:hypothetical protein
VFQKELYNGNPNYTAWGMLRKRLLLVRSPLSVNVFMTLATYTVTFGIIFLKHPALPAEVTVNRSYPRQNSLCFATS